MHRHGWSSSKAYRLLEGRNHVIDAKAAIGKQAQIVCNTRCFWSDEIRDAHVWLIVVLFSLLPQAVESSIDLLPRFIGVDSDIISN